MDPQLVGVILLAVALPSVSWVLVQEIFYQLLRFKLVSGYKVMAVVYYGELVRSLVDLKLEGAQIKNLQIVGLIKEVGLLRRLGGDKDFWDRASGFTALEVNTTWVWFYLLPFKVPLLEIRG